MHLRSALYPILFGRPGWVSQFGAPFGRAPDVLIQFANGRGWQRGIGERAPEDLVTVTANSTRYRDDLSGVWSSFAPNVLARTNKGARVWESRVNSCLWNRDLTNAAWVKTSATAAKNQTGIDNVANAASSITATAGNATVLQAITLASAATFQTAFVKRLIGAGVVNMTMDNGATWTAVTVTAAWTRVSIPTQTLANPTVGFRIVTSGDSIAVDFVQNEPGLFAIPPTATTTVAVTQASEVITLTSPLVFGGATSLYAAATPGATVAFATNQNLFVADDGTTSNRVTLARLGTTGFAGTLGSVSTATVWAQSAAGKLAHAYTANDQALSFNGAAAVTAAAAGFPAGLKAVRIGSNSVPAGFWNGDITDVAAWASTRISNAGLIAGTT